MRIGIDMLGNQSSSRNRGIGRYTRNLVSQLLSRHPRHEYVLYHYEGLPGMNDVWPGSPELRLVHCDFPDGNLRERRGANRRAQPRRSGHPAADDAAGMLQRPFAAGEDACAALSWRQSCTT